MAIAKKHSNPDDDLLKVGPDATATFDNSPSNPTQYASSENLDDIDTEEDESEDEDFEEDEEEEYDDEDADDEEYEEDDDEDDDEDDEDDDLAKGPRAPSVYRKM